MKIEVLYFSGCPNHVPAVERVKEALRDEGLRGEIVEIEVTDPERAERMKFLGSPSIRVDGLDIETEARSAKEFGLMCRTYAVNGRREGLPSSDMFRRAIREANSGVSNSDSGASNRSKNPTSWFAFSSVFAAIVASFCCILPIVFALTGFSILGASALFDAGRPYLLGLTFGLLGLGFYFAYRPRKDQCGPGSACAMSATRRSGRLMLWLATAVVVLFAAFPYYSGTVAEWLLSNRK